MLERTGRRELDKLEDRDIEMMSLAQSDELRLKSLRDQIQAKQQAISSFQQLRSQMGVDQVEAGERLKQLKDEYKMLKANNGEMER